MDATKLIEEAGRWAGKLRESTFADRRHYGEKFADLAAALKTSEEQNGAIRRGLDWERAEREKVAEFARKIGRERDEFAAANLAANKRIVELEQQVADAAALRIQDAEHCERLIVDRDAARAELEAERRKGCSNG